ncbi:MAG: hypothetical protein LBG58_16535 [Planctomycetaceae bacterium]|nr:hypothetical protein [Planctomycetaceae bacterium]
MFDSTGRQPFAEGFSPTVALPIGNSESDSIGQFVFLTGLETDCRRETGASRLSPTQPWVKTLRRKTVYLLDHLPNEYFLIIHY